MESKKKIIFISVGLSGGGAERVLTTLANRFALEGKDVTFLLLKSDKIEYELNSDIKIEKYVFNNGKKLLQQIKFIRKIIKRNKGCTIISFFTYQSLIAIIATIGIKCKIIVSERNDPRKTVSNLSLSYLRNILYKLTNKVVFQTYDAMNLFPNYIKEKSIVISNPLKEELPDPYNGERKRRFVAFSRLNEQKNIYMMIKACKDVFKNYNEYYLDIYGVGELREDLEVYAKECEIADKVNFKGFVKNIHEEILDATAFLSSSNYEGVSNSMLEAMAIGLPCICTDCPIGGGRMFIKNNENGILVEVNNNKEMAKAMIRIIEDYELRYNISKNAVKIKEQLSLDIIIKEWEKII